MYSDGGRSHGCVGRESEIGRIVTALRDAQAGRGKIVAAVGSAGIGKTTFLAAACRVATALGMQVLRAHGCEHEQDFTFGVARQLFEPVVSNATDEVRDALLAGAARFAEPPLTGRPASMHEVGELTASHASVHGLYWLAVNAATSAPLVVAIDDVHLCDAASLRWVRYLVSRVHDHALTVLITAPDGERNESLDELLDSPGVEALRLPPLKLPATSRLVRDAIGAKASREVCAACHNVTGGNPFLLAQLLGELEGREGSDAASIPLLQPSGVLRAVLRCVSRLSEGAPALTRAAAILGDGAACSDAAALASLRDGAADLAIAELERAGILRVTQGRLAFVHPIVRTTVYGGLTAADRGRAHGEAARMLERRRASPDRVARHLLAATGIGDPWAVKRLRETARRVRARGAYDEAVTYLERALQEPPRPDERASTLFELGFAAAHAGRPSGFQQMRDAVDTSAGLERAEMAHRLADALATVGASCAAADVLERTLDALSPEERQRARLLESDLLTTTLDDPVSGPAARDRLCGLLGRLGRDQLDDPGLCSAVAAANVAAGGVSDQAKTYAWRALRLTGSFSEHNSWVFRCASNALIWMDELDSAGRLWADALRQASRSKSVILFAVASSYCADVAYRQGRVVEAEAHARAALSAVDDATWALPCVDRPVMCLVNAAVETGRHEHASAAVESATRSRDAKHAHTPELLYAQGHLRIAEGRVEEGTSDLLECGRRCEQLGARNPAIIPWRSATVPGALAQGDVEEARRLAREETTLARRSGAGRALGISLRTRALTETGSRRTELLSRAVAVLEASPARLELARAMVDLGCALRASRELAEARAHLRRGRDLAEQCGATVLSDRAHEELLVAGARPRRRAVHGVDALTASELRVAKMAARAMTNREIATGLYVTAKTVEVHLSNAYRKLGIRSRSQLAGALEDLPSTGALEVELAPSLAPRLPMSEERAPNPQHCAELATVAGRTTELQPAQRRSGRG